ncbi:putative Zn-dependent protease-like protein [Caldisphaera lagunensis DSM 15908]|uniref:Putative Zn-dependent protease-like protein n=1 Tax=Caldisphaera lagunensis (strain DSM 15908 / JCM 11604 / ANMR 0165 / IC-154) TaxID=1056495 RepID=L0ABA3_CALLD|nr:zinc metalloprotease TldD [Caldisphaera lagunensis]AFZ70699.1 putative Zn-dependent protease-like protein [Caldisphaera lagunensis DSM 15908]
MEDKVNTLLSLGADFADIRYMKIKTLVADSSEIRNIITNNGISEGYALRALYKGNFGYKFTTNLENVDLKDVISLAIGKGETKVYQLKEKKDRIIIKEKYPNYKKPEEIIYDISKIKDDIFKSDKRIKSVNIRFSENSIEKRYASSDNRYIEVNYKITSLSISVVAKENDINASAHISLSTYLGYPLEVFDINESIEKVLNRVSKQLIGKPAKAGEARVILSPEVSGVFAHEALGHLAEADLAASGVLGKMKGKKIAKEFVNVSDSPFLEYPTAIGITPYDDEGVEGREVKIIENGVVKEFMNNRTYAFYTNELPSGNGRSEDFRSSILIRMRNTYFKPGKSSLEEMMEDIKEGYLMSSVLGGQTSSDGTFQFGIEEGYKIENGEIKYPLRNVGIAGYTLDTLSQISDISKDFAVWPGVCGKMGQRVYVGTGGPYVKVEKIKVGGVNE